jgi:hypothetical protein
LYGASYFSQRAVPGEMKLADSTQLFEKTPDPYWEYRLHRLMKKKQHEFNFNVTRFEKIADRQTRYCSSGTQVVLTTSVYP